VGKGEKRGEKRNRKEIFEVSGSGYRRRGLTVNKPEKKGKRSREETAIQRGITF